MTVAQIQLSERFNLASAMVDDRVNEGKGDKVSIYYKDNAFSFNDILQMVNRTGNALNSLGIEIEDRVAILLPDCPEWIASFFGVMKIGAVAVPFNTMLRAEEYQYFLNDSRAKAIIVSSDLLGNIVEILNDLNYLKHVIVVGEADGNHLTYDKLVAEASPELEASVTSKDDTAFWLYTSGSTGEPKGIVHLHHDLMFHAVFYGNNFLGINDNDVIFSMPKLFFSLGTANLGATFNIGASQILMPDRATPEIIFETITKYRPTVFIGVPTLYANLLAINNMADYDLSSIRLCISGGEPLPAGIFQKFKERFGIEVLEVYGSAEAVSGCIAGRPGRAKPGVTGELIPGVRAKIVDSDGNELPVGQTGELWVNIDSCSPGYWNKHDTTNETMIGSWLRTGDLFHQDEDGYFSFVGRVDDMMEAGGLKVAPAEVEAVLIHHPAVMEAAVVGTPDVHGIEKPKAYVTINNGYHPSPDLAKELQQLVKDRLAPYKYPRWVEFVKELPKTATGKIQRFKLR
ncbi:benzoate-CoA ligase family protein [Chloroflexota bacterium]